MATYELKRRYFEHGTYSTLEFKGDEICKVVERPDENNKPSISCVPEGVYKIVPHESPRFGYCYALVAKTLGVGIYEGLRTHILIHKGNTPSDVQGCLVVGDKFGMVNGEWAVVNSTKTFAALMTEFNGEEHTLIIRKG